MPRTITEKVNIKNSEQYVWGNSCRGWYFLKKENLAVIRETMPPGTTERLHYHKKSLQFFFIISGEAKIEVEGKNILLLSGEGITIEPGLIHCIKNPGNSELEFLVISQPESHNDRINIE